MKKELLDQAMREANEHIGQPATISDGDGEVTYLNTGTATIVSATYPAPSKAVRELSKRQRQLYDIIKAQPGITASDIFNEVCKTSRTHKFFGQKSVLAILFGPALTTVLDRLYALEGKGLIYKEYVADLTSIWRYYPVEE